MKSIFKIGILFCFFQLSAQVGINTTAPNAQLEIKASNSATPSNSDGIIIPRVDAFPATNPTAAQQGMMVYLTTTVGTNAPGFYYWDNTTTSWVGIVSTTNGDKDWYKSGTTTTPNNTDNMYHMANVGIGTSTPNFPLSFGPALGDKISLYGSSGSTFGFGVQASQFQIHGSNSGDDILFGNGSSAAFTENMRIKGNGFVGIGNSNPTVPLQFGWSTGDKISFFGNAAAHHGIGVQDYLMQIHGGIVSDDIAFGYGSSASMTEVMRIKGSGQVGIGTSTPAFPLSFASSLGDKISLYGGPGVHYGFGIQGNLMQIHSDLLGSDIAFGYGSSGSFTEGVRIRGNGNVGIGITTPAYPLNFATSNGDKISLYGIGANHYGFGIQNSLLQMHSATSADDIAFGYGSSSAFTERMRIKGSGNVGIGTSTPSSKLHVWNGASGITANGSALITAETNGTNAYVNVLSTQETGVLFGANGSSADGGAIYNSVAYPNSMMFRTGGNVNRMIIGSTGNVALGNFTPSFPLHFSDGYGDKISLWGSTASNHYGFGIQNKLLLIHSDYDFSDIAFGYGGNSSFTERMRIKGTGEVGIGTSAPTAELEVNGYTKLGSTAPAVKMLKLTGTTAASQGSQATINHGLTSSKILAINILVEYSTGNSVPPSYSASAGYEFDYYVTTSQIIVITKVSNSANILSKPIRILVTYEE